MLRYNSLIAAFFLFIGVNNCVLACAIAPQPDVWSKCSEELGLNTFYYSSTPELNYNRTCLKKCIYEKEEKLDADGNFVTAKFGEDKSEAASECVEQIKITDICRKVDAIDDCVFQRTDQYLKRYLKCETHKHYNEDVKEPLYTADDCFRKCQMVIDGTLKEDGKINVTIFEEHNNKNVTISEAFDTCQSIVKDEDACSRDVNMYYCVSFILNHWSSDILKNELECSKESNVYPFFGTQFFNKSRNCYERCLLYKNGELDASDITKSAYFQKMNATEEKINTCTLNDESIDECTRDIYMYDCINYLAFATDDYLKNQLECAKETKSRLVNLRNDVYEENSCQTRCIMIKEKKLHKDGSVNSEDLKQNTINEDIIAESIEFCKPKTSTPSCKEQMEAYYCSAGTIGQKVSKLCEAENNSTNTSPISVGINMCFSRCLMIHQGQMLIDGSINIDSFKYLNKEESVLKMAIENCKDKTHDEDKCTREVNTYNCVSMEAWNISSDPVKLNNASNSISPV